MESLDFPIRFSVAGVGWIPTSSVAQHLNGIQIWCFFGGSSSSLNLPNHLQKPWKLAWNIGQVITYQPEIRESRFCVRAIVVLSYTRVVFVFLWKSSWCDWALKTMWLVVSFGVRASTFESKEKKRNSSNSLIHNHLCSNTIATNWWMKLRGSWTSFEKHQTLTMKVLPIDRGRMSKHYI